ncbi:ribonuclease H-like domain-containing protein [Tanacetum coccineum]
MWLFRHKYLADCPFSRYKARLVANGSTQVKGIDVDETFSPVVKPGTIQIVLSLATSRHWPAHQLDVKNAFLHEISLWAEASPSGLVSTGTYTTYLLLYVDDIVLTASSDTLLQQIITSLHQDRTCVDMESKLRDDGDPVSDLTLYQSLAGSLQYLTFTRPDISYAVQQICLYMHDPREPHFSALKRILRCVRDWVGCPTTRRSTSSYCVFLGNNLLFWSSKRQPTLSCSSAEAEYRDVANVVAETC